MNENGTQNGKLSHLPNNLVSFYFSSPFYVDGDELKLGFERIGWHEINEKANQSMSAVHFFCFYFIIFKAVNKHEYNSIIECQLFSYRLFIQQQQQQKQR